MHLHNGFFASSTPKFLRDFSQNSFNPGIMKDSRIMDVSHYERKNDIAFFQRPTSFAKGMLTYVTQNHNTPASPRIPFSLILPKSTNSMENDKKQVEMEISPERSYEILGSGMVLLKNYVSLSEQVEIVNKCEELGVGPGGFYQPGYGDGGVGPGGFYQPGYGDGALQMICLGRNWDPETRCDYYTRSDGSEPLPIPDEFMWIVSDALRESRSRINSARELPLMFPDICIVNFYTTSGRLGLHQERDESPVSLRRGLPVVSVSIGDSAVFLYGDNTMVESAANILLESGDVLIFGGKSRHIFHGVKTIIPETAPPPLLKQTMLRPGRLNLTFRQI